MFQNGLARVSPTTGAVLGTVPLLPAGTTADGPRFGLAFDGSALFAFYETAVGPTTATLTVRGSRFRDDGTDLDATDFDVTTRPNGTGGAFVAGGIPGKILLGYDRYDPNPAITTLRVKTRVVQTCGGGCATPDDAGSGNDDAPAVVAPATAAPVYCLADAGVDTSVSTDGGTADAPPAAEAGALDAPPAAEAGALDAAPAAEAGAPDAPTTIDAFPHADGDGAVDTETDGPAGTDGEGAVEPQDAKTADAKSSDSKTTDAKAADAGVGSGGGGCGCDTGGPGAREPWSVLALGLVLLLRRRRRRYGRQTGT